MDAPPRFVTQREYRLFRCPCPSCSNHFFHCPFKVKDYELGGSNPGMPFACDPPAADWPRTAPFINIEHCARATYAYEQEYRSCLVGKTPGVLLAQSAKRMVQRYGPWLASESASKAWLRALNAFGYLERDPATAVKGAQAALATCPQCPDAHYVLGRLKAKTYEEALECFNNGTANYEKLLSGEGWAKCRQAYPYTAMAPPLHGAARCMVGSIQTLCRMRRGPEAYEKMQTLLRGMPPLREVLSAGLKVTDPAKDIWALAPEVVYRAKGPAACLAWLSEHMCDEVLEVGGAAVWWISTYALAWAATHQEEGFKWASLFSYEDESAILGLPKARGKGGDRGGDSSDDCSDGCFLQRRMLARRPRGPTAKLRSGMALAMCCCWLPHMVDMLTGDMPPPPGHIPPMMLAMSSMGAQVAYARYCGDLWRDTPGVLNFVRRYRNTYEVFCIISDSRTGRKPSLADFRHYMAPFPSSATTLASSSSSSSPAWTAGTGSGAGASGNNASGANGSRSQAALPGSGTAGSGSGLGASASSSEHNSQQLAAVGIFPDAMLYEGYGGWHGLVELVCTFTDTHAAAADPTMNDLDLEMLKLLLAAGCPIEPSRRRPLATPGPVHSPLLVAMHRGYGADAVRELLKAGADPLAADESECVPLINGAEQGMWRELQAVFKARRKLGPSPPPRALLSAYVSRCVGSSLFPRALLPTPRSVFELLLDVALDSSCLACVAGTIGGCNRCRPGGHDDDDEEDDDEDPLSASASPHGPWCNFFKVVEVFVAYGMTEISEPMTSYLTMRAASYKPALRGPQRRLMEHLSALLREAKAAQQRKESEAAVQQKQQQPQEEPQQQQQKGQKQQPQVASGDGKGAMTEKDKTLRAQGGPLPPPPQEQQQPKKQQENQKEKHQTAVQQSVKQQKPTSTLPPAANPVPTAPQAAVAVARVEAVAVPSGPVESTGLAAAAASGAAPGLSSPLGGAPPSKDKSRCCWCCGKEKDRAAGVKLRKCSVCAVARYCGEQCQREHWPAHREECKRLAAEAAQGAEGGGGGAQSAVVTAAKEASAAGADAKKKKKKEKAAAGGK